MTLLEVNHVSKRYADLLAVQDVSLSLSSGETLALLGPSGCGKSTLLRLIAGLERPDGGRVLLNDADVTDLPPERRKLGMVFQDYALFPHLDVLGNVMYGPRRRGDRKPEAQAKAGEALTQVGLQALGPRRIHELSGGQQQRVALARALASAPALLLLDEPLSNLDEQLRATLRRELGTLFAQTGAGVLLVTHDQREALSLADRVVLMRAGRVVQTGGASDVFGRPATAWAAAFLGERNLYPQPGGGVLLVPERAVTLGTGEAWTVLERTPGAVGTEVVLAHRLGPLKLTLSPREAGLLDGETLRAEVELNACLLLPEDRSE